MFNPKQALERIRKNKNQKQTIQSSQQQYKNGALFPQYEEQYQQNSPSSNNHNYQSKFKNTSSLSHQPYKKSTPYQQNHQNGINSNESLQQRMQKLQLLVSDLSSKLINSTQTIQQLKSQNHTLQTHILKLQNQNHQLKSSQKYIQLKNNLLHRLNSSTSGLSQNNGNTNKLLTGFYNDKNHIKKTQSKVIEDQTFSVQVQDAMEEIKKQPVNQILKRKEHNFRALKYATNDNLLKGEKALRQLANLHKNYGKSYKKPTLIINLEDTDFQ